MMFFTNGYTIFYIEHFYDMIFINLDPDLKFIFENPSKALNFLEINFCYPPHRKNIIICKTYVGYS